MITVVYDCSTLLSGCQWQFVSTSAAIKPMTADYHSEVPLLSSVSTPDVVSCSRTKDRQTLAYMH